MRVRVRAGVSKRKERALAVRVLRDAYFSACVCCDVPNEHDAGDDEQPSQELRALMYV